MGSVCHERLWLEFGAFWGAQTLEILERMLFQKAKTREFPGLGVPKRSALEKFEGSFLWGALWLEFGVFRGAQTLEILERMIF